MDGIDEYKEREFEWAVGTALVNEYSLSAQHKDEALTEIAEDLVDVAWEFICATFEDNGLPYPDRTDLTKAVVLALTQEREEIAQFPEDHS